MLPTLELKDMNTTKNNFTFRPQRKSKQHRKVPDTRSKEIIKYYGRKSPLMLEQASLQCQESKDTITIKGKSYNPVSNKIKTAKWKASKPYLERIYMFYKKESTQRRKAPQRGKSKDINIEKRKFHDLDSEKI